MGYFNFFLHTPDFYRTVPYPMRSDSVTNESARAKKLGIKNQTLFC